MIPAIDRAVEILGATRAQATSGVSAGTFNRWRKQGRIVQLVAAVRLSRATKIPVEEFAGEIKQIGSPL